MDDTDFVAYNIVNQLGDLWANRIDSKKWVKVRQATNDRADRFVRSMLNKVRAQALRDAADMVMDGHKGDGHCSACDMSSLHRANLLRAADHLNAND